MAHPRQKLRRHCQHVPKATGRATAHFRRQAVCAGDRPQVLSCVRHPCLLPFIGAVLNPPEQCFILSEWMPGGTLKTWIHGDQGKGIPAARHKLSACLQKALEVGETGQPGLDGTCDGSLPFPGQQVACGLQALQEMAPPVLHRDIKPSNILVDGSGVARVGVMAT